jgi:sirohydrochlorin ferrochelatase
MSQACLLIAHGSREPESNLAFLDLVKRFREKRPGVIVVGSFLELASPSIPDGLQDCIRQGADTIAVVPLMFFNGRHVKKDIPELIQKFSKNISIPIVYAGALAEHPGLLDLLNDKFDEYTKSAKTKNDGFEKSC